MEDTHLILQSTILMSDCCQYITETAVAFLFFCQIAVMSADDSVPASTDPGQISFHSLFEF